MNLFVDILKEKYGIKTKFDKSNSNESNNFKKSSLFTGTRSSQTYSKNHLQHIVNHSLNKNKPKNITENLSIKINQFFENQEKSVVYRRNVKTIQGTNRLAFPHSAVAQTISKETPNKPKDGIGVRTKDNTVGLATDFNKKLRIVDKLLSQKG